MIFFLYPFPISPKGSTDVPTTYYKATPLEKKREFNYNYTFDLVTLISLNIVGGLDVALEEDDAIVILQEIIEIKAKSAIFGRLLKLERVRINLIHQEQSDHQDHLLQVVDMFLEEELNPTWRTIINTLRHPLLNNYQLAQTIQLKYQGIINSYYVTYKCLFNHP